MKKKSINIILKDGGFYPTYGSKNAAGADVYANNADDSPIVLEAGDRVMVPTGIHFDLPDSVQEVQVRPRSGLAWKHGITVLNAPGTIDQDYQGECKVILINNGQEPYVIQRGERIAQFVFYDECGIFQAQFNHVEDFSDKTERGDCGFGSTGK